MLGTYRPGPVDVVEPFATPKYCSCGVKFEAATRVDLAEAWFLHLAAVVRTDPHGDHELCAF